MDRVLQAQSELRELRLADNLLGDSLNPIFSSNEFHGMDELEILDLSRNGLRSIEEGILKGCTNLEELYLDGNNLTAVPAASLKGPRAIRVLSLAGNNIGTIDSCLLRVASVNPLGLCLFLFSIENFSVSVKKPLSRVCPNLSNHFQYFHTLCTVKAITLSEPLGGEILFNRDDPMRVIGACDLAEISRRRDSQMRNRVSRFLLRARARSSRILFSRPTFSARLVLRTAPCLRSAATCFVRPLARRMLFRLVRMMRLQKENEISINDGRINSSEALPIRK